MRMYEKRCLNKELHRKALIDSVARGIVDADSGRTCDTNELRTALASRRINR
jgi:predicted transcriptional regulator